MKTRRNPAIKALALLSLLCLATAAQAMELQSSDLKAGGKIAEEFVFNGFGCKGANNSPELHWTGAPKGTKSFALTVYDPKAPTGSGWWHWVVINIPATTTSLEKGWKSAGTGATEITNDFGTTTYGGPCPPPGTPHPYTFTIYALKTEKLDVAPDATSAVIRFMINGAALKKASLTATYGR